MFRLTSVIVIGIISSLLLALTGSINPVSASLLLAGGGATLFYLSYSRHQQRHQLIFRSHQMGASSAVAVRHLGGLPFPIPTSANIFFTPDNLLVETAHDQWQTDRLNLRRIVIISAEQLHKLTDQEILSALSCGTSRLLSLVREKIRKGDSTLRRSRLLLLTYQRDPRELNFTELDQLDLLIFSYADIKSMQKLLKREELADRVIHFQPETGNLNGI